MKMSRVDLKLDFPTCPQVVSTCPGELTGFRPWVERAANSLACVSIHTAATTIGLALSLAACQTPAVHDRVVPISVPIAVQPIKPSDVPALPAPLPKRPADARQALDLALAQVCAFVAYGLEADPLLRVSAGLPPLEPPKYAECEH